MELLVVATVVFLGTHFVSGTPLRPALINAIGEWPYRGVYSLVAALTLVWMISAYAAAPREPLFSGIREIAFVLMPLAFVLIVCGYWRNPTMVGADKLLKKTADVWKISQETDLVDLVLRARGEEPQPRAYVLILPKDLKPLLLSIADAARGSGEAEDAIEQLSAAAAQLDGKASSEYFAFGFDPWQG